jgi:hypothetical protein
MKLSPFEKAVLEKTLAGDHPVLAALRAQLAVATVTDRELTGVGFFTGLSAPSDAPYTPKRGSLVLGGPDAQIAGLEHGAGFLLFANSGRMSCLEGFTYGEEWPSVVNDFSLKDLELTVKYRQYLDAEVR